MVRFNEDDDMEERIRKVDAALKAGKYDNCPPFSKEMQEKMKNPIGFDSKGNPFTEEHIIENLKLLGHPEMIPNYQKKTGG